MKKEKQSQVFKSFFKVQAPAPVKKVEVKGWYAPFEVKKDMVLAPSCRVDLEKLNFREVDEHLHVESQVEGLFHTFPNPIFVEQLEAIICLTTDWL